MQFIQKKKQVKETNGYVTTFSYYKLYYVLGIKVWSEEVSSLQYEVCNSKELPAKVIYDWSNMSL